MVHSLDIAPAEMLQRFRARLRLERREVVGQIRQVRIAQAVEHCSHDRVAAGSWVIAKLLHRVHEIRLILARKARDLVLSGVVRQMTGSAQ